MEAVVRQALLLVAAGSLGLAGWRVAALAGARGTERLLAAATVACTLAFAEAMLLGMAGALDEVALTGGLAVAAGVAAWRLLPAAPPTGLRTWWDAAPLTVRAGLGAALATAAGLVAWQLRHPHIGVDGFTYHLPLAGSWAAHGDPGTLLGVIDGVPVANYPVTNEVLLSWLIALSGSWIPSSYWTVVLGGLAAVALDSLLRSLGVASRTTRVLALATVASLPIVVVQLGAPYTDLPTLAWAITAIALGLAARREPRVFALALAAGGLAVGTKTTPAVIVGVALVSLAWLQRDALRRVPRPLALGLAAAVLTGLIWPLRNLLDHGSPLWPFVDTSFGDPTPAAFDRYDQRFLDDPAGVVDGRESAYLQVLAGGFVVLVAVLLAPLLVRTRAVLLACAATVAAALVWANAPYTGIDTDALSVGATRYLLPAITVGVVALAIAARDAPRIPRALVHAVLAFAILASLGQSLTLGFPVLPANTTLVFLAALGATAAGSQLVLRATRRGSHPVLRVAGAVLVAAFLGAQVDGYVLRHAESGLPDAGLLRQLDGAPDVPVAMGPGSVALVRGERLGRAQPFIGGDEPCEALRGRLERGYVVLQAKPPTPQHRRLRACLAQRPDWSDGTYELYAPERR